MVLEEEMLLVAASLLSREEEKKRGQGLVLPKSKRLNLKTSFRWVAAGQKTQTTHLKIKYRFGQNSLPLVGIAISSNIKKAHLRNKARRLVSAGLEQIYDRLPKGLNLVIMPNELILQSNPKEIKNELESVKNIFINN